MARVLTLVFITFLHDCFPTFLHYCLPGELIEGLKLNGLDHYTHLLTGYIGSASFLVKVKSVVEHLKSVNPNLIYGKIDFPSVKVC